MAADRGVVRQLGKLWDACRNIVARGVLTRVDPILPVCPVHSISGQPFEPLF